MCSSYLWKIPFGVNHQKRCFPAASVPHYHNFKFLSLFCVTTAGPGTVLCHVLPLNKVKQVPGRTRQKMLPPDWSLTKEKSKSTFGMAEICEEQQNSWFTRYLSAHRFLFLSFWRCFQLNPHPPTLLSCPIIRLLSEAHTWGYRVWLHLLPPLQGLLISHSGCEQMKRLPPQKGGRENKEKLPNVTYEAAFTQKGLTPEDFLSRHECESWRSSDVWIRSCKVIKASSLKE